MRIITIQVSTSLGWSNTPAVKHAVETPEEAYLIAKAIAKQMNTQVRMATLFASQYKLEGEQLTKAACDCNGAYLMPN